MRHYRRIASLIIMTVMSTIGISTTTTALPPIDQEHARTTIQNIATEALESIRLFSQDQISRPIFRERFRSLLERSFDITWIGRFVLGRYYRVATAEQRQEYRNLFLKFIVQTYTDRFQTYSNEQFRIVGSRLDRTGRYVFVTSEIILTNPEIAPVTLVWRLHKRDDRLRVVDLEIERISMGRTQRNEFATIIQRNGGRIEGLLETLRRQTSRY